MFHGKQLNSIFSNQFQPTPYWHDGVEAPLINQTNLPSKCDIFIIGAGYTGLVCALHLLRAGRGVVIVDAQKIGHGCSGKNGGMVGPSFHKLGIKGLNNKYGADKSQSILQTSMDAISYLKTFIADEKIDCDLAMNGRFRGAATEKGLSELIKSCEDLNKKIGMGFDAISPDNVREEIGSDLYHGGVVYHHDGGLQPYKLVCELARKVIAAGGEIHENVCVQSLDRVNKKHVAATDNGIVISNELVMATNGYVGTFAPNAFPQFKRRIIPIVSAMIATEELPQEMMKEMFPKRRVHGGPHRLFYYYRPSPDGKRLIFGGRGLDQKDDIMKHAPHLMELATRIYPALNDYKVDYCWSGKVAYSFDHAPHLGQLNDLWYAMGYCGSGVTRALYFGKFLAAKILGEKEHQIIFDQLPFNSRPFYRGNPWFLQPIIAWHALMDKLES